MPVVAEEFDDAEGYRPIPNPRKARSVTHLLGFFFWPYVTQVFPR
jgi:hypothetical protein